MNLTVLCEDYPSEGRPVFVFVEQLVNELAKQGVEISVVAPQSLTRHFFRHIPFLPKVTTIDNNGHPYIVYRPYSVSFGNGHRLLYKFVNKYNQHKIERVVEKINPDVLYGHFWHSAYKLFPYAKRNKKPLFVACGEGDNALESLVSRMPINEKEQFTNAVSGVISVSSENKRKCVGFNLTKDEDIVVLPNAVDANIFKRNANHNVRRELGLTAEDFLIAFTGAFIRRKGSDRLSEAVDKLNDQHVKVAFIGGSLDGDDATPNCKGIVHIGKINHDDVPQYLFAADCFCLPTLKEGCSNAIVEALAAGLPVISSNLPFNEDILNETNSIKIDPMNVDEIADAIKTLKDSPELRKELSSGALKMASNLRIDKRAAGIIGFIESKMKKVR